MNALLVLLVITLAVLLVLTLGHADSHNYFQTLHMSRDAVPRTLPVTRWSHGWKKMWTYDTSVPASWVRADRGSILVGLPLPSADRVVVLHWHPSLPTRVVPVKQYVTYSLTAVDGCRGVVLWQDGTLSDGTGRRVPLGGTVHAQLSYGATDTKVLAGVRRDNDWWVQEYARDGLVPRRSWRVSGKLRMARDHGWATWNSATRILLINRHREVHVTAGSEVHEFTTSGFVLTDTHLQFPGMTGTVALPSHATWHLRALGDRDAQYVALFSYTHGLVYHAASTAPVYQWTGLSGAVTVDVQLLYGHLWRYVTEGTSLLCYRL